MKRERIGQENVAEHRAGYLERRVTGRRTPEKFINRKFMERMILETGKIGETGKGTRYREAYSRSENAVFAKYKKVMEDLGLHTEIDSAGNLYGILKGKGNKIILTGSHLDGVRNGGLYDGVAGVVCSLEAARVIKMHHKTRNDIMVVAWRAEESSRFGIPYIGSKAAFGVLGDEDLKRKDGRGYALSKAMKDYKAGTAYLKAESIKACLELHAEQGRTLFEKKYSIGVVDSIAGNMRFSFELTGQPDHTGGCIMEYRKDAMVYASKISLLVNGLPGRFMKNGFHMTATVPNIVNLDYNPTTVPHKIRVDVEIRCNRKTELNEAYETLLEDAKKAGEERKLGLEVKNMRYSEPIEFLNHEVMLKIRDACAALDIRYCSLPSGAGHDTAVLTGVGVPSGMIFVPSVDGWAHHEKEHTESQDLVKGAEVLAETIMQMDSD